MSIFIQINCTCARRYTNDNLSVAICLSWYIVLILLLLFASNWISIVLFWKHFYTEGTTDRHQNTKMEFMKNRCDRIANERKRRSRKKVIDTERNETAKVGEHTDLYTSRLVKLRVFSLTYLKLHNRRQRKKRVFVCVCGWARPTYSRTPNSDVLCADRIWMLCGSGKRCTTQQFHT